MHSTMPERRIDGVLLLDKPAKLTSNEALQTVRRLFGRPKAGHTGTLDPEATGLLPICFGEAAKFASALLDADKTYVATVRLGQVTSTGDAEGTILDTRPVNVDPDQVVAALRQFGGEIRQVPPMHSAIKRNGTPLYVYARKGLEVERAARSVTVYEISLLALRTDEIDIRVRCSKGTYIRVLAEDIGATLSCGAHLKALRRTEIGSFNLGEAVTLEVLESMTAEQRIACLKPVDSLLQALPEVTLDDVSAKALGQGQPVLTAGVRPGENVRLYGPARRFLGLGTGAADGRVRPKRMLAAPAGFLPESRKFP